MHTPMSLVYLIHNVRYVINIVRHIYAYCSANSRRALASRHDPMP